MRLCYTPAMGTKSLTIPRDISTVLDHIESKAKAVSIFIYGSRARTDYKEGSDYEIGILFKRDSKWSRAQLATLHQRAGLNLYPFVLEDFLEYKLDTPFPKAIYIRELISSARTVRGEAIVEQMENPEIKLSDTMEEVMYALARSIGAVLSSRRGDLITTSIQFVKSNLFGTRALLIAEQSAFPISYDEIYKAAQELDLDNDSKTVIKHAIDVRKGKMLNPEFMYKNISYLNQIVYPKIKSRLANGDSVLLKGHTINW